MLEVDKETTETHLALGNLLCQRGEVEHDIRIHPLEFDCTAMNNIAQLDQDYGF